MANSSKIDVSIIIVNWNAGGVIFDCLDSLSAGCGSLNSQTWVVDNASTDGSVDAIRSRYPWVQLCENETNEGFAKANNQAARLAAGRYFLLLNPDTQLTDGALEVLVRYADGHAAIGCLGPQLLNSDGSHQRSCWKGFPGLGMALSDALYLWKLPILPIARQSEYSSDQLTSPLDVDHLLGACMLIRRETWEEVGALDSSFFLFLEETDWCYRARILGWRIVYLPTAQVIHLGEHSVNQQPLRNLPQFYRSYLLFYRKHFSSNPVQIRLLKAIVGLAAFVRIVLWKFRALKGDMKEIEHAVAMQAGYRKVITSLPTF